MAYSNEHWYTIAYSTVVYNTYKYTIAYSTYRTLEWVSKEYKKWFCSVFCLVGLT